MFIFGISFTRQPNTASPDCRADASECVHTAEVMPGQLPLDPRRFWGPGADPRRGAELNPDQRGNCSIMFSLWTPAIAGPCNAPSRKIRAARAATLLVDNADPQKGREDDEGRLADFSIQRAAT
jgi:hypothetical protein